MSDCFSFFSSVVILTPKDDVQGDWWCKYEAAAEEVEWFRNRGWTREEAARLEEPARRARAQRDAREQEESRALVTAMKQELAARPAPSDVQAADQLAQQDAWGKAGRRKLNPVA